MRFKAVAGTVIVTALVASGAAAGVIQGTLWMGPRAQRPARAPEAGRQRGVTDAVIYVERVPEQVERDLARPRRLWFFHGSPRVRVQKVVQRARFDPRVAVVAAGTRVAFLNLDRVYHNVFSVSPAMRFDLGKNAPGASDTIGFARPGVVNLHCDIHPDEQGYVVVTPNHVFTRPDSLGHYRLPKLPPGSYTVNVFHPGLGEFARTAEVPKRGDVQLDLVK